MPNQVLVVEDSRPAERRLRRELARAGLEVQVIQAGLGVLAAARSLRPAAIIFDVALPGVDVYSLCNMVKQDPETSHIPLVLLTEPGQAHDALGSLAAGADDYIPKDSFAAFNLLAALR